MSQKVTYKCSKCGYEADVYEGKGLFGQHITAVSCPDCRTIQNLVVGGGIGQVAPSFTTEVGRLCLRCGSNRIKIWDKPKMWRLHEAHRTVGVLDIGGKTRLPRLHF